MAKIRTSTIVTVAPFTVYKETGALGNFRVYGKKDGERFNKLVVTDLKEATGLKEEDRRIMPVSSEEVAERLVKNCRQYGTFTAEGEEPTEEELVKAESVLRAYYENAVLESDKMWAATRKVEWLLPHAVLAVRELGLKREWAYDTSEKKTCPNCGVGNPPTVARCACGTTMNWDLALKYGLLTDQQMAFAEKNGLFTDPETVAKEQTPTVMTPAQERMAHARAAKVAKRAQEMAEEDLFEEAKAT